MEKVGFTVCHAGSFFTIAHNVRMHYKVPNLPKHSPMIALGGLAWAYNTKKIIDWS
jgi:hypothetical protein